MVVRRGWPESEEKRDAATGLSIYTPGRLLLQFKPFAAHPAVDMTLDLLDAASLMRVLQWFPL